MDATVTECFTKLHETYKPGVFETLETVFLTDSPKDVDYRKLTMVSLSDALKALKIGPVNAFRSFNDLADGLFLLTPFRVNKRRVI